MKHATRRRWIWAAATWLLLTAGVGAQKAAGADEPSLAEYFGFQPLEVYKLENRIANLLVRDLDGDKVDDILIVNNGRSRIDLLLSSKGPAGDDARVKGDSNDIAYDRRMRLVSLPVNKEVVSLQLADFNGDGKLDIAYYGTPAELTVLTNEGSGKFGSPKRVSTGEAIEGGGSLTVGDLNRDGKLDLALLTPSEVVFVYQEDKGKLSEPERTPHTASSPRFIKAADVDGDGGDDLVLMDGAGDDPVRIRFSGEKGKLGPEQRFAAEVLRAYAFAQIDDKPGVEMLSIENQSGRVKVLTLDEAEGDEAGKRGRLIFYPLPPGTARGRTTDVGDLDGDGKADVVVTDPANAQFLVYRQSGTAGLGSAQTFPGLVGGRTVRLADLDGDKKAEVYVLSDTEKQIGRATFEGDRLGFPAPLPTVGGDPVALDLADLDGDKTPEIVYITRGGGTGTDAFSLRALKREKSGTFVPYRWGTADSVAIKGLSGLPPAMKTLDVNDDGHADILIFNAFGAPVLLLGHEGSEPTPAGSLGPLSGVTPAGLTQVNLNGPGLLVSQNAFARNLKLDKDGRWEVKDQYNAGRASAQIQGAAALDIDGDGKQEIVLLDRASKSLIFLEARDGVYRPSGTLSVGPIDFQGVHVADFNGDGKNDLLLSGTDRFGVVVTGSKGLRLKTLASYESNREDARLGDLAAGDLNNDGKVDIVLIDVAEHFVEIVTYAKPGDLQRAISFKVFDRKSFRDGGGFVEPRDLGIGDVDGDGLKDLVLIVHDRVLVYRQDPGPDPKAAEPVK
ncbi:VCBS repeat-containing protein [Isosphaeraceae bacterium EP7]